MKSLTHVATAILTVLLLSNISMLTSSAQVPITNEPQSSPSEPAQMPITRQELDSLRSDITEIRRVLTTAGDGRESRQSGSRDDDIAELRKELSDLRVNTVKEQLNSLENRFNQIIAGLAVLLAIFGIGPFILGLSAERRARQAHSLAIRGEEAAQGRASQIHTALFDESRNTLTLVNQTLELAKDASERAATAIQKRAVTLRDELNREANEMLTEASTQDDRWLISKPEQRSDLTSLATKIANFEINSFTFPDALDLNPDCHFIRGMDFHLKQQFRDALKVWSDVAHNEAAQPARRSLAWYWIGYEQNNLGEFDRAEESFRQAERHEPGDRRFELRRIRLESRFFNKDRIDPYSIIPELDALVTALTNVPEVTREVLRYREKVHTTFGNVLFECARHTTDDKDRKKEYYKQAEVHYRKVVDEKVDDIKWGRFGLGQVLFELGQVDDSDKIFDGPALADARAEYTTRAEPRTKVLARSTELICCALVDHLREQVKSVYGDLIVALGNVDNRLTVYSQFQKRNVKKDRFKADLDAFLDTHKITV
jgi:tetratricopeptide (TPR) repeat protein